MNNSESIPIAITEKILIALVTRSLGHSYLEFGTTEL
jgi:hypothetical protein